MTAQRLSPVERCFGPAAASGGPFELLGLPLEPVDERVVHEALRRRLARLAASPYGATPEADEVRLALHAAAAQLCDPLVRERLLALWREQSRAAEASRSRDSGPEVDDKTASLRLLALRVLARSGGWNRRSRRRVAALAHALGVSPSMLAQTLRRPGKAPSACTNEGASTGVMPPPSARVERAGSDRPATAAAIVQALERGSLGRDAAPRRLAQGRLTAERKTSHRRRRFVVPVVVTAMSLALASAAGWAAWRLALGDAAASDRHAHGGGATLSRPAAEAAPAAGSSASGAEAADAARPAVASSTSRLQTGLLEEAQRATELALEAAAQPKAFDQALAALSRAATGLPLGDTALWKRWRGLVDRLEEAHPAQAEQAKLATLTLDAVESVLTRSGGAALTVDVVKMLLDRAPLGDGAPPPLRDAARRRVLGWFDDRAVSAAAAAALSEALAQRSDLALVRPDMTLAPHAGFAPRQEMRDRYARAFGLASEQAAHGLPARWVEAAKELLHARGGSDVASLARAEALLRFTLAAALRQQGDVSRAAELLASFSGDVAEASAPPVEWIEFRHSAAEDGRWAAQVFAAGTNAQKKIKALFDLTAQTRPLGPIDADMLALLAVAEPRQEVRLRAQRALRERRNEPAVINGLLEALPQAHSTLSVAALVEEAAQATLPPPGGRAWRVAAQRALARRLLTMLEGAAARQGAVAVEHRMGRTLSELAQLLAPGRGEDAAQRPPEASEAAKRAALGAIAQARLAGAALRGEVFAPDAIERRLMTQTALARGPAQRTAAALGALAEAQAATLAASSPQLTAAARRAVLALTALTARARSSVEQIELASQTLAALWLLREQDDSAVEALWRRIGTTGVDAAAPSEDPAPQKADALCTADGAACFEEAERIALHAAGPAARTRAQRLYAASLLKDNPPSLRSVALALRELATSDEERRTLESIAQAAPSAALRVPDWRQPADTIALRGGVSAWSEDAALALLLYQAGRNAQAARLLEDPRTRQQAERALTEAGSMTPLQAILAAVASPACSVCKGQRFVRDQASESGYKLCPSCQGDPGPHVDGAALAALLRAQLLLLGEPATRIVDTLMAADHRPLTPAQPALLQLRYNPGFLRSLAESAAADGQGRSGGA